MIAEKEACMKELSARCEDLWREIVEVKQTAELEHYRALKKEREKWEDREDRMLSSEGDADAVGASGGKQSVRFENQPEPVF